MTFSSYSSTGRRGGGVQTLKPDPRIRPGAASNHATAFRVGFCFSTTTRRHVIKTDFTNAVRGVCIFFPSVHCFAVEGRPVEQHSPRLIRVYILNSVYETYTRRTTGRLRLKTSRFSVFPRSPPSRYPRLAPHNIKSSVVSYA